MSPLHFLVLLFTFVSADRELIPLEAPGNLTLLEINRRQVLIQWDPVLPKSVRGNFRGYLVRSWNEIGSQVYAFPPEITKVSVEFFPFSKNFITVSARNEKYVGPPSEAISFDAPQLEPSPPSSLTVYPLSNISVLLKWKKPLKNNGILLGYKIYGGVVGDKDFNDGISEIFDPEKLQAKLTGMEEGVRYRIGVSALNCAGESDRQYAEIILEPHTPSEPFPPKFSYKINYTTTSKDEECFNLPTTSPIEEKNEGDEDNYYDYLILSNDTTTQEPKKKPLPDCLVDCLVQWIPDVDNVPGESFYLRYKIKGEKEYQVTDTQTSDDFIILHKFNACKNYEMILTVVDGDFHVDSRPVVTPTGF